MAMAWEEKPVTCLPPNYPAYCIYVPTGMDEAFERDIIKRLRVWGRNMGQNLYVARWNIADPTYIDLMKALGFKRRPMLILTDENNIRPGSYIVALDDPVLVRAIGQLTALLPQLLDLILIGEHSEAAKKALSSKRETDLKNLLRKLGVVAKNFKVTFAVFGFKISIDTN